MILFYLGVKITEIFIWLCVIGLILLAIDFAFGLFGAAMGKDKRNPD